jgi:SAM-dependent methyltransferase
MNSIRKPLKWLKNQVTVSRARRESNRWLKAEAVIAEGRVLSIGSLDDSDGQGGSYRDYFSSCSSYTTSEVDTGYDTDLILDVRSMSSVKSGKYDCIYCSGVLEHVDDFQSAVNEITRILRPGGLLLLGVPFRQAIHLAPTDYWRFTRYGLEKLLERDFDIKVIHPVDSANSEFPAAYWVKATKLRGQS